MDRPNPTMSRMLHEEKAKRLMKEAEQERRLREAKEQEKRQREERPKAA
jgi:hypothetical protein